MTNMIKPLQPVHLGCVVDLCVHSHRCCQYDFAFETRTLSPRASRGAGRREGLPDRLRWNGEKSVKSYSAAMSERRIRRQRAHVPRAQDGRANPKKSEAFRAHARLSRALGGRVRVRGGSSASLSYEFCGGVEVDS